MHDRRIFLGWNRPCLHAVVDYLHDTYSRDQGQWDMSGALCVTQGARAGRRLLELLAQRTESDNSQSATRVLMIPPGLATVGQLPEKLYSAVFRTASPLELLLARTDALRQSIDVLSDLLPNAPETDDLLAWYRVANDLGSVLDDLDGDLIGFDQVVGACNVLGFDDGKRWMAIEAIRRKELEILRAVGLRSLHEQRLTALLSPLGSTLDIILIASVDLPKITREFLNNTAAKVTPLVWAPGTEAERFDELGCVKPKDWQDVAIPLANPVQVVNYPGEQASVVVNRAVEIVSTGDHPEQMMSVALGDESIGPTIERLLELSGIEARRSTGRDAATTPPALVLKAIAQYIGRPTPESLAVLLRQPDISGLFQYGDRGAGSWPASLDSLAAQYLPSKLNCGWEEVAFAAERESGDDTIALRDRYQQRNRADSARNVISAITASNNLIGRLKGPANTLPYWSTEIGNILADVYGWRPLDTSDQAEAAIVRALKVIGDQLERQLDISPLIAGSLKMSSTEAIRITLQKLTNTAVPEAVEQMAVEISGWLDAPLDDIPLLVIAGVNEGFLPQSVSADAFLPNSLRSKLGLTDNEARYARDAYLLSASSHSRGDSLILVSGRKSVDGDPVRPSRLMFACSNEQIAKRALAFYDETSPQISQPLLAHGTAYTLAAVPKPLLPLKKPFERISVSAFKHYLACPYRFYLRNVVRLSAPNTECDEMDAPMFGNLAHDVLHRFADSPFKESENTDEIASFLASTLQDVFRGQFGADPLPSVEIQIRQLRKRLERFAQLQAGWTKDGWRIVYSEKEVTTVVVVDDIETTITGKIDRIDFNEAKQLYRIVDYKTSDTAKPPDKTHRTKSDDVLTWIDLQLPLYRDMVRSLNMKPTDVRTGYIMLPKDPNESAFAEATWTENEYEEAYRVRDDVIRGIRSEIFWPPSENPPGYSDGLETICMDLCPDRKSIVASSTHEMAVWFTAGNEVAK